MTLSHLGFSHKNFVILFFRNLHTHVYTVRDNPETRVKRVPPSGLKVVSPRWMTVCGVRPLGKQLHLEHESLRSFALTLTLAQNEMSPQWPR